VRKAVKAKQRSRRTISAGHPEVEKPTRSRRNDLLPLLKIEPCPVDDLKSYSRKLRKSELAHVDEIANSISTLGFNVPLLIGKDNIVIDGESRLAAAKLLGLSSVPCIRVDHLDETEQRLLRMAVNRLGEKGSWDVGELKAEFEELIIADAPIEITGFGSDEIDQIIIGKQQDQSEAGPGHQSEAGVLAALGAASPIARYGDLFLLGRHRVICGNATDSDLVKRLMGTDLARLVFTDPRFQVAMGAPVTLSDHREEQKVSAELTEQEFLEVNRNWMKAVVPHLVDGGLLGSFIDWRSLPMAHAAATALGLTAIDLIVLAQPNAGTGHLYPSQHKLLPLFKKGVAAPINSIAVGTDGRHRSNLWTYPAASVGSDASRARRDLPAANPGSMLEDALADLTTPGEIVLDPFLGSGETLFAAQNTGRVCCGVELDPLAVDGIIRRYHASTGIAAIASLPYQEC
jgi:DNA modification methylase